MLEGKWAAVGGSRTHTHPFAVKALVVQCEMWLVVDNDEKHLLPGDTFALERAVPHVERYGAEAPRTGWPWPAATIRRGSAVARSPGAGRLFQWRLTGSLRGAQNSAPRAGRVPNAGHGFNVRNPHFIYREEDAADAWARTLAFLKRLQRLGAISPGERRLLGRPQSYQVVPIAAV